MSLLDRLALVGSARIEDTGRLRARLVVSIALLSVPFWVFYGGIWYVMGLSRGLFLSLAGAGVCLIWIPILRAGLSPRFAGRGLAFSAAATFLSLAIFVRGFDLPLLSWNLLIPVAAVLFRGLRTAYQWILGLTASWLLLWWLDHRGYLPRPGEARLELLSLLDLSNLVGAMVMLVMIVGSHARLLAKQEKEREELRNQLTRSEHMASLGTLSASMGHEINNPLSYTIYNLEYLCDSKRRGSIASAEEQRALREALQGARRVERITTRLNAFARFGAEPGPALVQDSVQKAIDRTRAALGRKLDVRVELEPELTVCGGEELVQVLLHLMENAADAIDARLENSEPGLIQVRGRSRAEWAELEVSDNGVGIPSELRTRIFDPFFTTKRPGEGIGLGLAISRQIVARLCGEMWVDPGVARGTVVKIRLPLASLSSQRPQDLTEAPPQAARVLIVDDEPALLHAMRRHLRDFHVDIASTGTQALQVLRENAYALVLCDVMMPQMTGPELYLRAKEELGESIAERFVFMTGGAFLPQDAHALRQTGCSTFPKPIAASTVREQIDRLARHAVRSPV